MARLGGPLSWTEVDERGEPVRVVEARPERWGDVVLARKDLGTSYHLAVVTDDALQGVTHVVRGEDLFEAIVDRLLQGASRASPRHSTATTGSARTAGSCQLIRPMVSGRCGRRREPVQIRTMLGFAYLSVPPPPNRVDAGAARKILPASSRGRSWRISMCRGSL